MLRVNSKAEHREGSATRLLTIDDVADLLGVPKSTLYGWRSRGEGPVSLRVGRHVRYEPADVQAWIESRKVPAST